MWHVHRARWFDAAVSELSQFLKADTRTDVKAAALQHVLGLTGSEAGRRQLLAAADVLAQLKRLVAEDRSPAGHDASLALLNLSGFAAAGAPLLAAPGPNTAELLLRRAVQTDSRLADACCMVLSNLSRHPAGCAAIWRCLRDGSAEADGAVTVERLVLALCQRGFNTVGCKLDYLGPLLSNLTQLPEARSYMLDRDRVVFQRLLPFTDYQESLVRRTGVIGAIKNCCFETDSHMWLLGPDVDLLPRLLLPLTGPEPYDDEDMEKLPVDLQYMDETKTREADVDIRKMLLEAITQLCATRSARERVRAQGAYLILREYHKWETDEAALELCEELVNILIKTEDEIGVDDLKAVQIPNDVAERLHKESSAAAEQPLPADTT
ncbi:protein HGH1 homolog isoform X1 [Amphibalanus amphitrite]|uniref:protein HGH1 homolog isoform X1 n=1 Tax=Amphibalanus amphitrite TaxID=1232801 RepID=UPI001C91E669|nr:protein HGH1 homolog isoform X1 [Amphibalanus amphitrite]